MKEIRFNQDAAAHCLNRLSRLHEDMAALAQEITSLGWALHDLAERADSRTMRALEDSMARQRVLLREKLDRMDALRRNFRRAAESFADVERQVVRRFQDVIPASEALPLRVRTMGPPPGIFFSLREHTAFARVDQVGVADLRALRGNDLTPDWLTENDLP